MDKSNKKLDTNRNSLKSSAAEPRTSKSIERQEREPDNRRFASSLSTAKKSNLKFSTQGASSLATTSKRPDLGQVTIGSKTTAPQLKVPTLKTSDTGNAISILNVINFYFLKTFSLTFQEY
jgi:hypothetical protein